MGAAVLQENGNDATSTPSEKRTPKKMLSESQIEHLTKTGYQIIGSHSAVKMCRWTKNSLKCRGQCYKHTFYGISSHQCMEMTPSLACANKCIFCWRNYSNPVTLKWKYEEDDPIWIVENALQAHKTKFIKQVISGNSPTLSSTRSIEAQERVRHCALSLVGEPVIYPRINELLGAFYERGVSTFVVTNGQFPKELESVNDDVTTQMYCSVDAFNERELKRVGRPLFADAWDRLRESLTIIGEKKCRTVARLTYLKDVFGRTSDAEGRINDLAAEVAEGYADLILLGAPDFVEVKGATFAPLVFGKNGLTKENVPTHTDVLRFAETLRDALNAKAPLYAISCEHHHSCSVLLTRRDRWLVNGRWRTWIDFDNLERFEVNQNPSDFSLETPDYALFGSPERGLDPMDTPRRSGRRPDDVPV